MKTRSSKISVNKSSKSNNEKDTILCDMSKFKKNENNEKRRKSEYYLKKSFSKKGILKITVKKNFKPDNKVKFYNNEIQNKVIESLKCEQCQKIFTHKISLTCHLRTHKQISVENKSPKIQNMNVPPNIKYLTRGIKHIFYSEQIIRTKISKKLENSTVTTNSMSKESHYSYEVNDSVEILYEDLENGEVDVENLNSPLVDVKNFKRPSFHNQISEDVSIINAESNDIEAEDLIIDKEIIQNKGTRQPVENNKTMNFFDSLVLKSSDLLKQDLHNFLNNKSATMPENSITNKKEIKFNLLEFMNYLNKN